MAPYQKNNKNNVTGASPYALLGSNNSLLPGSANNLNNLNQTHIMECPKHLIGKIIGKKGEVINSLQMKSFSKIQIDQNVPPGANNKIIINGNLQNISLAISLINDLLNNTNTTPTHNIPPQNPNNNNNNPYGHYPIPNNNMPPHNPYNAYPSIPNNNNPYNSVPPHNPYANNNNNNNNYGYSQVQAYGNIPSFPFNNNMGNLYLLIIFFEYFIHAQIINKLIFFLIIILVRPLPKGWSEHKTDEGNTYWHNAATGVSQVFLFFDILLVYFCSGKDLNKYNNYLIYIINSFQGKYILCFF